MTVLDAATSFLPRVEPSIAKLAKEYMEEDGIVFEQGVKTSEVKNDGDEVVVVTDKGEFRFDALLYATGRKPNIEPLHLENTDIALTERGGIQVNKHLETSVPGVFAVGDVNGGLQFTYISLDDFRIVFNYLTGMVAITLKHVEQFQLPCSSTHLWHRLALLKTKPEQQVDQLLSRNFQLQVCLVDMLMAICVVPSKLW